MAQETAETQERRPIVALVQQGATLAAVGEVDARDWHRLKDEEKMVHVAGLHSQLVAQAQAEYPGCLYAFPAPIITTGRAKLTPGSDLVLRRVVKIRAVAVVFEPIQTLDGSEPVQ